MTITRRAAIVVALTGLSVSLVVLTQWQLPGGRIGAGLRLPLSGFRLPLSGYLSGGGGEVAAPQLPVPNLVHFVQFGKGEISFVHATCILAAARQLAPDRILVHTDVRLTGPYWAEVEKRLGQTIKTEKAVKPTTIFGKKVDVIQHASDFFRILVLIKYGGIYLDNDAYVVRDMRPLRQLDKCAVGLPRDVDPGGFIGNQIFVCPPQDPFMVAYRDSYRTKFDDSKWYYNAGEVPTVDLILPNPGLVNAVPDSVFAVNTGMIGRIFTPKSQPAWKGWRNYTAIHLLYQHRSYMVKGEYAENNEHTLDTVRRLPSAFGEMARLAWYGTTDFV